MSLSLKWDLETSYFLVNSLVPTYDIPVFCVVLCMDCAYLFVTHLFFVVEYLFLQQATNVQNSEIGLTCYTFYVPDSFPLLKYEVPLNLLKRLFPI